MNVFFGLDVSLASTAMCVVSEHGEIVKEMTAASEPETLIAAIREIFHEVVEVGLEAGPLSQWPHKGLQEAGVP